MLPSNGRPLESEGIEMIEMWDARTGKVPAAVESTAALMEAILSYQQRSTMVPMPYIGSSSLAACDRLIRLHLSMAIVRFVNGIVDPKQRQAFSQSVNTHRIANFNTRTRS